MFVDLPSSFRGFLKSLYKRTNCSQIPAGCSSLKLRRKHEKKKKTQLVVSERR